MIPFSVYGQSVWVGQPYNDTNIGVEVLIPSFDNEVDSPSGILHLYSHVALSDKFDLLLDLPINRIDGGEPAATVGNPFVGFQYEAMDAGIKADFGVRVPLSGDNISLYSGTFIEPYEVGAFRIDALSVLANIHYRYTGENGLIFRIGGGPEYLNSDEVDGDLFLKYYRQLLYSILWCRMSRYFKYHRR